MCVQRNAVFSVSKLFCVCPKHTCVSETTIIRERRQFSQRKTAVVKKNTRKELGYEVETLFLFIGKSGCRMIATLCTTS